MRTISGLEWPAVEVFAIALGVTMLTLTAALFVRIASGRKARDRAVEAEANRPALHDAFVELLANGKGEEAIRRALARNREEVADALLLFHGTVGGSARDRLRQVAVDLGLVDEWKADARSSDVSRRRRGVSRLGSVQQAGDVVASALDDADEEVRISAARGIAQSGAPEEIRNLFEMALGPAPLTRIVLTEELRRHATMLCAEAVPEIIAASKPGRVCAVLDIVAAWERALPLRALVPLLEHHDREVRVRAFRLAPFIPPDRESRLSLLHALNDDDLEIRSCAIVAIGRQKIDDAIPQLALCMRRGPIELSRRAAEALANMPPVGELTLEELADGEATVASQAAKEQLRRRSRGVGA